jgi:hypothetical protein
MGMFDVHTETKFLQHPPFSLNNLDFHVAVDMIKHHWSDRSATNTLRVKHPPQTLLPFISP